MRRSRSSSAGERRFDRRRHLDSRTGSCQDASAARDVLNQFVEVEADDAERILARIGARQRQHVVDDARQAPCLVLDDAQGLTIFGFVAMGLLQRHADGRARRRDRGAELVRSVRHESPLRGERFFEALQELVERLRESAELVGGIHDRHARAQSLGRNRSRLPGHRADRQQTLSRNRPAPQACHHDRHRHDVPENLAQRLQFVFDRFERLACEHDVTGAECRNPYALCGEANVLVVIVVFRHGVHVKGVSRRCRQPGFEIVPARGGEEPAVGIEDRQSLLRTGEFLNRRVRRASSRL